MGKRYSYHSLVESALTCLSQRPHLSMNSIASQMGVGRATLHRYFETRDSLMSSVWHESLGLLNEKMTCFLGPGADFFPTHPSADTDFLDILIQDGDKLHLVLSNQLNIPNHDSFPQYKMLIHQLHAFISTAKNNGSISSKFSNELVIVVLDAIVFAAWQAVSDGYIASRIAPHWVAKTFYHGVGGDLNNSANPEKVTTIAPRVKSSDRKEMLDQICDLLSHQPNLSLNELAAELGLSRATMHRYFHRREDLLLDLSLQCIYDCERVTKHVWMEALPLEQKYRAIIQCLMPLGEKYHYLSSAWGVLDDPKFLLEMNRQWESSTEIVQSLKAQGSFRQDVPSHWVVAIFDSMLMAFWSAVAQQVVSKDEACELFESIMLRGVANIH